MAVNNGQVRRYVQAAFDAHPPTGDVTKRVTQSWQAVNSLRVPPRCGDYSLVAADHYLFMRYMVNVFSPAFNAAFYGFVGGYDGIYKGAAELWKATFGGEIVFRTGDCPPSGFSVMVNAWSLQGIRDGTEDWYWTSDSDPLKCPDNPYPFVPG